MLVHVAIETRTGTASAVAQRLALVQGLSLREVGDGSRLIGSWSVPDSCAFDDVVRTLAIDSAVLGVSQLEVDEDQPPGL